VESITARGTAWDSEFETWDDVFGEVGAVLGLVVMR